MSSVNGIGSGAATAELMKILESSQQAQMELAEKVIKLANTAQVAEAEATGLGKAIDLYA